MEHKCNQCAYARLVISENGLHYSCMLSSKAITNCVVHNYSKFVQRVLRSTMFEEDKDGQ